MPAETDTPVGAGRQRRQRFAYYNNLNRSQKHCYDSSDAVESIPLTQVECFYPMVEDVALALEQDARLRTQQACQVLIDNLVILLQVPQIRIRIKAVRPQQQDSQLYGLYEAEEQIAKAQITLWMRTAQRRQVVRFPTFMRTLLHEFVHHLDFTVLGLHESFHTQGFFMRESDLYRQLVGTVRSELGLDNRRRRG